MLVVSKNYTAKTDKFIVCGVEYLEDSEIICSTPLGADGNYSIGLYRNSTSRNEYPYFDEGDPDDICEVGFAVTDTAEIGIASYDKKIIDRLKKAQQNAPFLTYSVVVIDESAKNQDLQVFVDEDEE